MAKRFSECEPYELNLSEGAQRYVETHNIQILFDNITGLFTVQKGDNYILKNAMFDAARIRLEAEAGNNVESEFEDPYDGDYLMEFDDEERLEELKENLGK